jgi:hypothetical protein
VQLAHRSVAPGKTQKVTVSSLPDVGVHVLVRFPDGSAKTTHATTNSSGAVRWSYKQPASRITRASRTARVTVDVSDAIQTKQAVKRYTIGFAAVDVTVQPRSVKRGHAMTVWAHSASGASLTITIRFPGGATATLRGVTGQDGWWSTPTSVPAASHSGTARVAAYASSGGATRYVGTAFHVR